MARSSIADSIGRNGISSSFDYASLDEAFPAIDPGLTPFGSLVLVQLRQPKTHTAGGISLPSETIETDKWNSQVAKVISLGPAAFRNRDTLELWPEGVWCQPGEYIRVPKHGGDRWEVPFPTKVSEIHYEEVENPKMRGGVERIRKERLVDSKDNAIFILFRDLDLSGKITANPLSVIAFI